MPRCWFWAGHGGPKWAGRWAVLDGLIFPSSAITDSFGRASTVYTAGSSVSAQDGVLIDAEVIGTTGCQPADTVPTGPCNRVTITVSQQSVFVTLGTSHLISDLDDTRYAKPFSVLVTDVNGNPIQGADVELNVFPARYKKGFYFPFETTSGCVWGKVLSVSRVNTFNFEDDNDRACENEDINRNGIIEAGEDINNNGELDPENPASVPVQVTTDESGFGIFDITYARQFTWTTVELEARTVVAGSEAFSKSTFELPGLATDFNNCQIEPPGRLSPYGQAKSCICDELTEVFQVTDATLAALQQPLADLEQTRGDFNSNQVFNDLNNLKDQEARVEKHFLDVVLGALSVPLNSDAQMPVLDLILEHTRQPSQCPTLGVSTGSDLNVELSASLSELPSGGGTVFFTVRGGTEFLYRVTTTDGSFAPNADIQAIDVEFGQSFTLYTNAAHAGEFITVTATDQDTGFNDSVSIQQDVF